MNSMKSNDVLPLFFREYYCWMYRDVADLTMTPEEHYIKYGEKLGRKPNPNFDPKYYASQVDASEGTLLKHYYSIGRYSALRPLRNIKLKKHSLREIYGRRRLLTYQDDLKGEKSVTALRKKLLNFGIEGKALEELRVLCAAKNHGKKYHANKLFAVYTLNNFSDNSALQECLSCLDVCLDYEVEDKRKIRLVILKAEVYFKLGNLEAARELCLNAKYFFGYSSDLYLLEANLSEKENEKISVLNEIYDLVGYDGVEFNKNLFKYDKLAVEQTPFGLPKMDGLKQPLVSIIMPSYNAESTIELSIRSMLNQSYQNIEILVVDDCSTDKTSDVVYRMALEDSRLNLLKADVNGGPYVARNIALNSAKGKYVTCNDADDWSHPQKISTQVIHLESNEHVVANCSNQARCTNLMEFHRRGNPGFFIFPNMSSLMFRKDKVMSSIGYWDSVRFGADSEFIRRIKIAFGSESVITLNTPPLSFQRQSEGSLTGSSAFGYHGFFMGARKEHFESYIYSHNKKFNPFYSFPMTHRPYRVPEPMLPQREVEKNRERHFDVIIASDFRLDGGSTLSCLEEIRAHKKYGLRTGLIQLYRYDYPVSKKINPKIRDELNGNAEFIVYGEKVSCQHFILRYPPSFQYEQNWLPDVSARQVSVIVNQTPLSEYSASGQLRYKISDVAANIKKMLGTSGVWYPIGPLIRDALIKHHESEISEITLAKKDWYNIVDIEGFQLDVASDFHHRSVKNDKLVIGRHSRDNYVKWPGTKEEILTIYPERQDVDIRVLGGIESVKKIINKTPENWTVYQFGSKEAADFLNEIDVFVYFTNKNWVEAFGRVIIEAMVAGVPVILPEIYRPLFKEAALYCKENEVIDLAIKLKNDLDYYSSQVNRAKEFAIRNFGYGMHIDRLSLQASH